MENNEAIQNEAIKKDPKIKTDRLRFQKNKTPALLAYLSIVFDVLYFILIYKTNDSWFYNYILGLSVVVNLLFLLAAFLSSEEIKNYKVSFGIVMIVLGAIQLLRIIYPLCAYNGILEADAGTGTRIANFDGGRLTRSIIYLCGSAASMIIGGVIGIIRTKKLAAYKASIGQK